MKKKICFSIIFIFLAIFLIGTFFSFSPSSANADSGLSFLEFEKAFTETNTADTQPISISKDIDYQTLVDNLSKNSSNLSSEQSNISRLTSDEVKHICNDLNYYVYENENGYDIYHRFQLQTLLIRGDIEDTYGASTVLSRYDNYHVLRYSSIEETENAYKAFKKNPDLNVMTDLIFQMDEVELEGDGYYDNYYSWGAEEMDLEVYNNYLANHNIGTDKVVVILDSGLNTGHSLFQNRVLRDANGYVVGYSYYASEYTYSKGTNIDSSQTSFEDDQGHGTHVAGTVVDLTPENVKILPIKALSSSGSGSFGYLELGINRVLNVYSTQYDIACMNMSLGAYLPDLIENGATEEDFYALQTEFEAIFKNVRTYNILPVVAAGNDADDVALAVPANCSSAVTVSALGQTSTLEVVYDNRYSNYGSYIDISAPGTFIYSAIQSSTGESVYGTKSGTSMATPHISAAIALISIDQKYYDENKNFIGTAAEIENKLYNFCVEDKGYAGRDDYYGYGMVNFKYHAGKIAFSSTNYSGVYDGQAHTISVEVTDSNVNATISYKQSASEEYSSTLPTFTDYTGGTKIVYFKISAEGYEDITSSASVNITKAPLSITLPNYSLTYGATSLTIPQSYTMNSGLIAGDSANVTLALSSSFKTKLSQGNYSVGTYSNQITATSSNTNYTLTYSGGDIVVNKKDIKISLSNQSGIYGNTVSLNSTSFTVDSSTPLASWDSKSSIGVKLSIDAVKGSAVGTYPITCSSSSTNYNIECTNSAIFTITPKSVTVTINTQTGTYGEAVRLNQSSYSTPSGAVLAGDNLKVNLYTLATATSNVGNYTIYGKYDNDNYKVTFKNGTYYVAKRDLTIRLLNQTASHSKPIKLDNDAYMVVSGNIVNSKDFSITISTEATSNSEIGEYELTATCDNANYNVTFINGTLQIYATFGDFALIIGIVVGVVGIISLVIFIRRRRMKNKYVDYLGPR